MENKLLMTSESLPRPKYILDPLEGIIEGESRLKRYINFVTDVLGKIWVEAGPGEFTDDFYRSTRYDRRFNDIDQNAWVSGYTQFSPLARDPRNLTEREFQNFVDNLGTLDYVRLRSVPPQLLIPGLLVASVGGSCALETNSVHTVNEIKAYIVGLRQRIETGVNEIDRHELEPEIKRYQSLMQDFVRKVILAAPTITHISGAMLGGYNYGVHYWETDMWRERIEMEYGIPHDEAVTLVDEAYQRIHEAVQRRSLLINPESAILAVNFDEFALSSAVEQWLSQLGLDSNNHRVLEVIYTYVGPNQLELLKQVLSRRLKSGKLNKIETKAIKVLIASDFHVRGKQIDHLRWGSMDLPKEVIMGLREMDKEEKEKFDNDYAYRMGIVIMRWVYQANVDESTRSVAAGFTDLPTFNSEVQHEERSVGFKFKGVPGTAEFIESVNQQLTNPARLNRFNLDIHLKALQQYSLDTTGQKKVLSQKMIQLQEQLLPLEKKVKQARESLRKVGSKIEKYKANIKIQQTVLELVKYLSGEKGLVSLKDLQDIAGIIKNQRSKSLENARRKQAENAARLTVEERTDLEGLPDLIKALETVEHGEQPIISSKGLVQLNKLVDTAEKVIEENKKIIKEKELEESKAKAEVVETERIWQENSQSWLRLQNIKDQLSELGKYNPFPLTDNPFIHHAMQFLWDSDFVVFLKEAVKIQEGRLHSEVSKDEAVARMKNLVGQIYPKLEAYLKYLYGQIDYPTEFRFSQILNCY